MTYALRDNIDKFFNDSKNDPYFEGYSVNRKEMGTRGFRQRYNNRLQRFPLYHGRRKAYFQTRGAYRRRQA